jgi:acyl carrier protein
MKDAILSIVIDCVKELNYELEKPELDDPEIDTPLYGIKGSIDSLSLVSLTSDIEQNISDKLHKDIILADERAMSQRKSPFRTVGSLVEYIAVLIEES